MSSTLNELGKSKYFANRGLPRNKCPLSNIIYKIEIVQLAENVNFELYKNCKYGDGYLSLIWAYQRLNKRTQDYRWYIEGAITINQLKELLNKIGKNQWHKFVNGKREFILQRRRDRHNVSKKDF